MKSRRVVLVVGITAIIVIAGYVAYNNPLVRSWFAGNNANQVEIDRAGKAALANEKPVDPATGYPQWRGPSRTGVAPAGTFRTDWDKTPPKELWREPVGGGFGSCAVVGGQLYVQDRQGGNERVLCLDAESGKQIWEYSYPAGQAGSDGNYAIGPRATPTVVGKWVFATGGAGQFLALEVEGSTAKVRWQYDLLKEFNVPMPMWGVAGSPLVLGDLVIVQPGGKNGAVVAFDKTSGDVKWKAGSNPPSYSSPVAANIGGQVTVFAFLGDALLAIRPTDGKVMSSYGWPTSHRANIATPLVVDEQYVFISSSYNMGCALLRAEKSGDEVTLQEVYSNRRRAYENHHATSVFKDRHLFGIDGEQGRKGLKCVEFITGKVKPDWDGSEIGQASLILAGEHLILQTASGDLCLVEANTNAFNLIARIPRVLSGKNNWATPTLVNGRLYMRDEAKVVCFDVRP